MTNEEKQFLPILQSLGIDEEAQSVYLALLKYGSLSIRRLSTYIGINRGKTYEVIKRLVALGLVTFKRSGEQRHYAAETPLRIYDLIEEKKKELTHVEEQAEEIVPALLAVGKQSGSTPVVRFYEDDEGVVAILRDVLTTTSKLPRKEYYAYSSRPLRHYLYRKFPNFTRRRIKEQVFVRVIAIGEGGDPAEISLRKNVAEPPNQELSSYILIYGTKVATISVSADGVPFGVVIDDPGVAATQRLLFEKLWDSV